VPGVRLDTSPPLVLVEGVETLDERLELARRELRKIAEEALGLEQAAAATECCAR
jgi:hypothetical protein